MYILNVFVRGKRQNYRLYGVEEVGFGSCMGFQGKAFKYSDNDNVKAIKKKKFSSTVPPIGHTAPLKILSYFSFVMFPSDANNKENIHISRNRIFHYIRLNLMLRS